MTSYLDKISNLLFLVIGIIIGLYLNKEKLKQTSTDIKNKIESILIKPSGQVLDSKEENSLNKITDEVNYHHNSYFDQDAS